MQIIITSLVQAEIKLKRIDSEIGNLRWHDRGDRWPVVVGVLCRRCCRVGSVDTWTGPPWRCVAVSTINCQAEISGLYMVVERGRRNWAFAQKSHYHPFRVRSLHPFSQTGTYQSGAIVESRRETISSRKRLSNIIVFGHADLFFSLSSSPLHSPTHPHKRTHAHTHTRSLALSLYFCVVRENRIPSIGGGTVYNNNIYIYVCR
jgi:hypothetical protein